MSDTPTRRRIRAAMRHLLRALGHLHRRRLLRETLHSLSPTTSGAAPPNGSPEPSI